MFISYASTATWTMSQVISDIAALTTGAELTAMSASCNQALSSKTGTAAAGWQIHDSAASAANGGAVIKAQDRDSVSTKYCGLIGASATVLNGYVYNNWNSSTHAGTSASTAVNLTFPAGQAFTLSIFTTKEYIVIILDNTANSIIFGEILRDTPFIDKNILPIQPVQFVTNLIGFVSPISALYSTTVRNTSTGATIISPVFRSMTIGARVGAGSENYAAYGRQYQRPDGSTFYPVNPIFIGYYDPVSATNQLYYGRMADSGGHSMLFAGPNIPNAYSGDIMIIAGQQYKYYPSGILVPLK